MNETKETSLRGDVMKAISAGKVRMRPRWHFLLLSALALLGVLILFLTLLYVSSLAVFFLRDSGAWFAPSFGMRGWWSLVHGVPWLLVLLVALFIVVLQLLARRYAFVYHKPLLTSALLIVAFILFGGFAIARTPFHHELALFARHGQLPPPVRFWYEGPVRPRPSGEVYHGVIMEVGEGRFTVLDPRHEGTTTVFLSPRTRLPYGGDFSPGEFVVIIGDSTGTGTLQAFGVQRVEE